MENEKEKKISFSISLDKDKIEPENIITIEGIKIYFPYKAYQVQIDYMTKVIQTLNKGNNISALKLYAYYAQFLVGYNKKMVKMKIQI